MFVWKGATDSLLAYSPETSLPLFFFRAMKVYLWWQFDYCPDIKGHSGRYRTCSAILRNKLLYLSYFLTSIAQLTPQPGKITAVLSLEPLRPWPKYLHKEYFLITAEILGKKKFETLKRNVYENDFTVPSDLFNL